MHKLFDVSHEPSDFNDIIYESGRAMLEMYIWPPNTIHLYFYLRFWRPYVHFWRRLAYRVKSDNRNRMPDPQNHILAAGTALICLSVQKLFLLPVLEAIHLAYMDFWYPLTGRSQQDTGNRMSDPQNHIVAGETALIVLYCITRPVTRHIVRQTN